MIYLDNAATTWPKPPAVLHAVQQAMEQFGANPGRGGHAMSMRASEEVYRCRETAARLFHLDHPENVIFTMNCTMSLNIVLKGILSSGGRAVVSSLEHNAVMRPLEAMGWGTPIYDVARVVPLNDAATVEAFERCITPQTRVIVCTHASNVFGVRLPIRQIGELALKYRIPFVVDAAQSAGILPIDMQADHIDFLCMPGHKGLYGPMGTGLLLCSGRYPLPSFIEGGTGSQSIQLMQPEELPEHLESGTLNLPGICGLRAGMETVEKKGIDTIHRHETQLVSRIYTQLKSCPGIRLYTTPQLLQTASPVLSFNVSGYTSEEAAARLDRFGIAVRARLHCAPCAHQQFGTLPDGTVRVSPSMFTTPQAVDQFCSVVKRLALEHRRP